MEIKEKGVNLYVSDKYISHVVIPKLNTTSETIHWFILTDGAITLWVHLISCV